MEIVLASFGFIAAVLLAGTMGFAIQRGATCTVAAVNEVVEKRRFRRLLAMAEASLWVTGGLLIAQSLHLLDRVPAGYPVSGYTILGGALLGLGAYINGACVFGAIARLGSGQWDYAATPLGFYVGCLTVNAVFSPSAVQPLEAASFVLRAPGWLVVAFIVYALWRLGRPLHAAWSEATRERLYESLSRLIVVRVWAPHAATIVIGISFFLMLLLVGAWAYTDVLTELARRMMAVNLFARIVLLVALLSGAILGGWTAGLLRSTGIAPAKLLTCFTGGMLMGWGSLLIPGGNDGLILVGMPLLWPYAWVAFAAMCLSIGAAAVLRKTLMRSGAEQQA